jgi:hypothetical protein
MISFLIVIAVIAMIFLSCGGFYCEFLLLAFMRRHKFRKDTTVPMSIAKQTLVGLLGGSVLILFVGLFIFVPFIVLATLLDRYGLGVRFRPIVILAWLIPTLCYMAWLYNKKKKGSAR